MTGRRLGHYEVGEALGRGGMGVVYRAVDTRLRRAVALKVLPAELATSPHRRERFLREAQAASALNHPGIVTIHDVGSDNGVDFIVMELVDGRTLRELMDAGPLGHEQARGYTRQAASALAAAHAAGIVHRDIKPQNLMITAGGTLKILDFGLARLQEDDPESPTGSRLTALGTVAGTPGYMSPEQAEGRSIGPASDVFSLGVVLYEMVTGRAPFDGPSVPAILYNVVHKAPESPERLRPDVPADLAQAIDGALHKDPAQRPADGAALAALLETSATNSRAAPSRPTLPSRMRASWKWIGSGLLVAAALVGLARAMFEDRTAGQKPAQPSGQAASTDGAREQPVSLVRQGTEGLTRYYEPNRLVEATAAFEQAAALDPGHAPAYAGLSEAYWRAYRRDRDATQLAQAIDSAREAVRLDPLLASAHAALALAAIEAGRFDEARAALEQASSLDPLSARVRRALGALHQAEGDVAKAERAFVSALEIAPRDWELHVQLGALQFQSGRYEAAAASFAQAVALSPDNPVAYRNLGAAQYALGRYPEAGASFQRSLEIQPDAIVYGNLGALRFRQGFYAQAVAAFERSLALGPNDPVNWRNLGGALKRVPGRSADARQAYTRAVQLLRQQLASAPGDVALRAELAVALLGQGNKAEAMREASAVEL